MTPPKPHRRLASRAAAFVLGAALALLATSISAAIVIGDSNRTRGVAWGVGTSAGQCRDVIDKMRNNWFDVRPIVAPKSKTRKAKRMRPRRKDFYCVSPAYASNAMRKIVPLTTGLECFELQGRGFCCDRQLQRCATM